MDIFGVGPLELFFIFLIALIVFGPNDLRKAGLTLGKFMRKIVKSPTWQEFKRSWNELRFLPNKLMRDAGLEDELEELQELNEGVKEFQKSILPPMDFQDPKESNNEPQMDFPEWTGSKIDQTQLSNHTDSSENRNNVLEEDAVDMDLNLPVSNSSSRSKDEIQNIED